MFKTVLIRKISTNAKMADDMVLRAAKEFLGFVNKAPSPYHAVDECRQRLVEAGFKELKEKETWDVKPLDKCFVTRNQSTLIAFAVGGSYKAGNGFSVVGAHTDSPCLKVKPVSRRVRQGYAQVGVELYGGGIWHTWFDRDLKVAGRVIVKNGDKLEHRLVNIDRPIMRIPNIAIHLHREMNDKFEFNKENQLLPVIATSVQEQLVTGSTSTAEVPATGNTADKHHPILIKLLTEELNISPESIVDFELCLADAVPGTIGGALNEFIYCARLDNLHSSFCALQSLIASCQNESSLKSDDMIRMISLFDNEEVGSQSAQGAGSSLQEHIMRRLCRGGSGAGFEEAMVKSLMISADMAHAVHPNYSEKHEEQHRPALHKGVVVKTNANQRYATTTITRSIIREIGRIAEVPLQDVVVRNDSPCGSTIGPIMSAALGIPTVDVGSPQLSMHSIREMCCVSSVKQSVDLFTSFFNNYPAVYNSLTGI